MECCYKNILETSTVSLSAGAEDQSFPLYRIYDRDIGKIFRAGSAATLEIKIDQSASPIPADRFLLPAGHNLDGMNLKLRHSDDDVSYTDAIPEWIQQGNGLINKSWASLTKRLWKFIIAGPASAPEAAEIFISETYTWEGLWPQPSGLCEDIFNAEHDQTASGLDRFLIHGGPKRQRVYKVRAGTAQKNNMLALYSACQGSKPFWFRDHEGEWIYGRLRSPLNLLKEDFDKYSFVFDFEEVIG